MTSHNDFARDNQERERTERTTSHKTILFPTNPLRLTRITGNRRNSDSYSHIAHLTTHSEHTNEVVGIQQNPNLCADAPSSQPQHARRSRILQGLS
jgi:hypothetical protein